MTAKYTDVQHEICQLLGLGNIILQRFNLLKLINILNVILINIPQYSSGMDTCRTSQADSKMQRASLAQTLFKKTKDKVGVFNSPDNKV